MVKLSTAVLEAKDAIFKLPLPEQPVTVIVAVFAAPWAIALVQAAVAVPPRVILLASVLTVTFAEYVTVQTKLAADVPTAGDGPVTEEMLKPELLTVAFDDGPVQLAAEFDNESAAVAAAKEAILTLPLPVQPVTVIVAVLAAPCAMAFVQPAVSVPPKVTFVLSVDTVTFLE